MKRTSHHDLSFPIYVYNSRHRKREFLLTNTIIPCSFIISSILLIFYQIDSPYIIMIDSSNNFMNLTLHCKIVYLLIISFNVN